MMIFHISQQKRGMEMDAKTELVKRLLSLTPQYVDVDRQAVADILKDYTITRETEGGKSDLAKRITYYLGAKRIDGLSPQTIKNYKYTLDLFANRINKSVTKITTDDVRGHIAWLSETRKLAESSLQTHINTLRAFFGWLHTEEKIKKNPMLKIKSVKLDRKGARHALTVDELERLRDACVGYRDKAIVEFLVATGCRISEITSLYVDNLNFAECSVQVTGKGDKARIVYFTPAARLMVQKYTVERKGGTALFASSKAPYTALKQRAIQRIINTIGKRANLNTSIYPHLLRHTFATHNINKGMDVMVIQRLLGHEDIATTQIYATMNEDVVKHQYTKFVAN